MWIGDISTLSKPSIAGKSHVLKDMKIQKWVRSKVKLKVNVNVWVKVKVNNR
jgi:hypothetical protein